MKLFRDLNSSSPILREKIEKLSHDMHLFYSKPLEERDRILERIRKLK